MAKSLLKPSQKSGMRPGSLVHVGAVSGSSSRMTVLDYDPENIEQAEFKSVDEILRYKKRDTITWVLVEGLANVDVIQSIGANFDIHDLVLEDILNTHQRPKFEEYDDHLFIVLKCLLPGKDRYSVAYEQISLLVLKNFVFVFKENTDALFAPLQQRIVNSRGRFRRLGSDYLTYTILDTVIDQNFIVLDALDETVTELEDSLLVMEPARDTLYRIQRLKKQIIDMRRHVSPVRELMAAMLRSESDLIDPKTHIYLRDVSDHVIRVIESIELYRDTLTGLLDIYLSSVNNKMNQIMKVLTVFASIFIPLTFITGIYGMNFESMPELHWKWAYPALWGVFATVTVVLLVYFKKKKWL